MAESPPTIKKVASIKKDDAFAFNSPPAAAPVVAKSPSIKRDEEDVKPIRKSGSVKKDEDVGTPKQGRKAAVVKRDEGSDEEPQPSPGRKAPAIKRDEGGSDDDRKVITCMKLDQKLILNTGVKEQRKQYKQQRKTR